MMMFAAAALRANFLPMNAALPADTSSTKQTQIVSALSISVSIPEMRALNPSRFRTSATTSATQSSSRPKTRDAEHSFSKFARVKFHHFICRLCTTDCLRLDGSCGSRYLQ